MVTYYKPFGATTYNLASSISSTATTIVLSSFLEPVTGTPYTMALLDTQIVFATIAPKTTSSEFISFTGITQNANGTATLTGVTRGLSKKSPFTTDSTYKLPHSGQSQFIISDAPQVFYEYAAKNNDETITGQWTFNVTPITPPAVSDASTTVKGITKLSVAPASATSPIALGTNDARALVGYAVDSVGTDSYAITPSPAITAYAGGQVFTFTAGTANTGACTLNVSGLGAKTIKKNVSSDLATGDILANQIVVVEYDGTNMQLVSLPSGVKDATKLTGVVPLANGGTASAIPYKSGVSTISAPGTGSVTNIAHGLGVIPGHIKITAYSSNGTALFTSSVGTSDGTTNASVHIEADNTNYSTITDATYAIYLKQATSAIFEKGIVTCDATNIIITWTTTSAGTGAEDVKLLWEAMSF